MATDILSYMYIIYEYHICVLYIYIICVYYICIDMCCFYICICMLYMYIIYLCCICVSYMYICMLYMGGFGVILGSDVFCLTYFSNSHNINDSASSTQDSTFDTIDLQYFHTLSLILHQSVSTLCLMPQLFL